MSSQLPLIRGGRLRTSWQHKSLRGNLKPSKKGARMRLPGHGADATRRRAGVHQASEKALGRKEKGMLRSKTFNGRQLF